MRASVGNEIVLLEAREFAPGSLLNLKPGAVGTVVRVTGNDCAADFGGVRVVVPLELVAPVRYRG